jgi:hypothetical protein
MKNFQSTIENSWTEILAVSLTEEQIELLNSQKNEDNEARIELLQLIKSQRDGIVELEKLEELNKVYNLNKPKLEETDKYQLISIDLFEKEKGKFTGIINCRVNEKHNQIRF